MPTLADIARGYAADPSAWPVRPCFDPERRWYHRIFSAGDHEAWLLTWLPGQGTDLHDHGGSAGAFVVLRGELTEATVAGRHETRAAARAPARPDAAAGSARLVERRLAAGSTRPFGPAHVHQVRNAGVVPAVSLHVYAPALARMRRYELSDGTLRLAELELAGRDW